MKRFFTTATLSLVVCLALQLNAQIQTPAASPGATFKQTVGLTDITIEYSRPSMKGRKVFAADGLVPYGTAWRTGANAATKITFNSDVTIEGQELKSGSYAILTVPNPTSWDVKFFKYEEGNFGTYLEKTPEVMAKVTPMTTTNKVESFLITIGDLTDNDAVLKFVWDNVTVPVKIGVNTDKTVMASIDRVMAGPSANDYFNAGVYFFNSGKDKVKALEYVQKATSQGEPRFWQLRMEAEILAALGRKKEAIQVAEKSKMLAKEANNNDYIKINTDNIAKWSM